ncbi:MAG: radical SAM protein [Desulfobacterales bacterium]
MDTYRLNDLEISIDKQGATRYTKASYPVRYGRFCEVKTPQYLFQYNLNGELKTIRGLNSDWPHPAEWLKRTDANDWVFYSVGRYHRLFSFLGEYYLPCFSYPSNSPWEYNPFGDFTIQKALAAGSRLVADLRPLITNGVPCGIKNFVGRILRHHTNTLSLKTEKLHQIIGGPVSVLPPDTRHVDYEVIPLMIADGCLYHCDFCCVKSHRGFERRCGANIRQQIRRLKAFYGANLGNYNALFLGNHDALAAGGDLIGMSAIEAYEAFDFAKSHIKNPALFLFGSADSLLKAGDKLFEALNWVPFYTYINIGLESADMTTLAQINKPIGLHKIKDAFQKMLDINRRYLNIEITANFLLGGCLAPDHYVALIELIRSCLDRYYSKGAIYLSPLKSSHNRAALLRQFIEIKAKSRLPTYLYLIQRL